MLNSAKGGAPLLRKYFKKIVIIALFLVLINLPLVFNMLYPVQRFTYKDFIKKIESGEIASVSYNKDLPEISGITVDGERFKTTNPQTDDFKKYLLEKGVEVTEPTNIWSSLSIFLLQLIGTAVTMFIVAVIFSKVVVKHQNSIGNKCFYVVERSDITFDDVAGNEEAKESMMELVDFLRNPVKYARYGAKIPKGTILYGPPGTGKTLLAKALAGTAGVPFIAVSGSDFVEKFVGVGAARVRQLFELARKKAPCIIFIDEIDAVGRKRGIEGGGNDERDQTVNQLLAEMDGFTGNEGIIVIAATNRLDVLDKALLRSGRFDRHIKVDLPDVDARYEILKIHSRNKPLNPEVDLREVAKLTLFMSGADLANVMNEASIYAAKHEHKGILMSDIDKAINKILVGEEKKNRNSISKRDKEVAAFHEAGHTLVAKLLAKRNVTKATIIPTTKGAGGYTMSFPQDDKMFETKQQLLNEIAISLGGRAAEEIIFGEDNITGGASQDLKIATRVAIKMVKDYGMSKNVGLINIDELYENGLNNGTENDLVIREVRNIIDETYKKVKEFLNENKCILYNLAQALLQKEVVYEKEIDEIINGNNLKNIVSSTLSINKHVNFEAVGNLLKKEMA